MAKAKDAAEPDAVPADPAAGLDWDAVRDRATDLLKAKADGAEKATAVAGELLARGFPEGAIKSGHLFDLGPENARLGFVWGLNQQGSNKGYFGLFGCDSTVRLYRVLRHKPDTLAEKDGKLEGGNDFVLVDKWTSPVIA